MTVPSFYTTKGDDGITFDRAIFIRDYATHFVAAWTARHYEDYCATDRHAALGRPPWEDALFCAGEAWDHLVSIQP